MKAAVIFTGSGPILILTSFDSLDHPTLAEKLGARGITKFIAYEVSVEKVRRQYGTRFSIILSDLSQTDDMRVMDINGHYIFNSFSFPELGTRFIPRFRRKAHRRKAQWRIQKANGFM